MKHAQIGELADAAQGDESAAPASPGAQQQTPWLPLRRIHLEPGDSHTPVFEACEYGYLLLAGSCEFHSEGFEAAVQAPSVLRCAGALHHLVNTSDSSVSAIVVRVAGARDGGGSFGIEAVDEEKLSWRPAIHGGRGRIATRHIWVHSDFESSWTFLDHAVLAPDSSVGYHNHGGLEESFVVLEGRGYMTIDGDTFRVEPGSVTFQGIGEGHGIYNSGNEVLSFLRIAVGIADEEATTIDLGDDLASRRP